MKRILLVDDDESLLQTLSVVLTRAGYAVATAVDGHAALASFRASPVDVIIIDLLMPDKEGLESITELRELDGAVKIIAISGGGSQVKADFLPVAKVLGANVTLRKPFSNEALLQAVGEVLGRPGKS